MAALGHQWWKYPALSDPRFRSGYERIRNNTHVFLAEQGYVFDARRGAYLATCENTQQIALFAHQGFGTVFMSSVLNIPYPMYSTRFDMCHTGMTAIEFPDKSGPVMPTVLTLSNDSHIYCDGLPTNNQNRIRF